MGHYMLEKLNQLKEKDLGNDEATEMDVDFVEVES